jgi:hypothetical protein
MQNRIKCLMVVMMLCLAERRRVECDCIEGVTVEVSVTKIRRSTPISAVATRGDQEMEGLPIPKLITDTQTINYQDVFIASNEERLLRWTRKYLIARTVNVEEFDSSVGSGEPLSESSKSSLEGKLLTFEWCSEAGEFQLRWPEVDAPPDAEVLGRIVKPSASASFLCPTHAAGGEASWDIPFTAFRDLLLAPGGAVFSVPDADDSEDQQFDRRQREAYLGALHGRINATIGVAEEHDDPTLVRILLSGKCESNFAVPVRSGESVGRRAMTSSNFKGIALWNKSNHCLEAISLDGDGLSELNDDLVIDGQGGAVVIKVKTRLKDEEHWELKAKRRREQ